MTTSTTGRRQRQLETLYAVVCAVMLIYAVAKWRGWIGGEPLFRPLGSVLLVSFCTVMAAGWLALHRSNRLAWLLLGAGGAVFLLLVANMMAG